MVSIDNLSNDAFQTTTVVLADGTKLVLNLNYLPAVQRWTVDVLYNDAFTVYGINLTLHPNVLRSFRNIIPFGISCVTTDGADPFDVEDFASARAVLYVLDSDDVGTVETSIAGTVA